MRQNFSFFHTVSCVTATQKSAKDNFHSLRSLWIEILKWWDFCSHLELVIIGWMWHVAVGLRSCISRTQVSFSQSAEGHCSCRARHSWPRSYWVIEPCKKDFNVIMWNIDINIGTVQQSTLTLSNITAIIEAFWRFVFVHAIVGDLHFHFSVPNRLLNQMKLRG